MPPPSSTAYIGIGSNTGDRSSYILRGLKRLSGLDGITIVALSPVYQTRSVGGPPQRDYLNAVAKLRVRRSPAQLIASLLAIEKQAGRKRRVRWGPRCLDLDLLTFGNKRIRRSNLIVPHPRYHKRRFVLTPFCDLSPGLVHPVFRRTNRRLLRELTPTGQRVTIWTKWKKLPFYQSKRKNPPKLLSPR